MATSSTFAAQFPEADFRDAIRQSMRMGMPESDAEKLIWRWERDITWVPQSPGGRPYDLNAVPVVNEPGNPTDDAADDGLIVDYAIEDSGLDDESATPLGLINTAKLKVTVFDVDFEKIRTADFAMIGTVRYHIDSVAPPYALFGVTMHDIHLQAVDSGSGA